MRHRMKTVKLGRSQSHRDALLSNQVCSLIEHSRIKTTLAKAKAVRPLAEKNAHARQKRHAPRPPHRPCSAAPEGCREKICSRKSQPRSVSRNGGYTRIIKLGPRQSDSAPLALIEWVDAPVVEEVIEETPAKKSKAKKSDARSR